MKKGFRLAMTVLIIGLMLGIGSAAVAAKEKEEDFDWMPKFEWASGSTAGDQASGDTVSSRHDQEMDRIKKENPERYARLVRIKQLAWEYRNATDEKRKAEIEKEIRPLIEAELRYQQERNKKRVEELEKRVARMRKVLDDREKNWDKVVDFVMAQILGKNDRDKPKSDADQGQTKPNK